MSELIRVVNLMQVNESIFKRRCVGCLVLDNARITLARAINSKWDRDPVWVHGDVASGNLLVKDNRLVAVIDFGCMGIGDPACDLTIAWTFLRGENRKIFKANMDLHEETWARARGWAMWKALYEISVIEDKSAALVKQQQIIDAVIKEDKSNPPKIRGEQ